MWGQQTNPSSDDPWPVAPKAILTYREQELYRSLHAMYPDYRIFVQVALSQLIDVPLEHPDRFSIRGHFKQLVADFVLCRADLSVVTVIELDDRSHERADRKDADARKTKALADAGLRLIRIPAGNLPSPEQLRDLIDRSLSASTQRGRTQLSPKSSFIDSVLRLNEPAETIEMSEPPEKRTMSRTTQRYLLKAVLLPTMLILGWVAYAQFFPHLAIRGFQSSVVQPPPRHVAHSIPAWPPKPILPEPAINPVPQPSAAASTVMDAQTVVATKRAKDRAWLAFYSPPASCEHPVDWKAQVECGNQYMRAKRLFEAQWLQGDGLQTPVSPVPVLDNQLINGAPRSTARH